VAEDASPTTAFAASRARFDEVISWAAGQGAADLAHRELEAHLFADARETFRQVLQDILDLRAEREARLEGVLDAAGVAHGAAEDGHDRALESVFGTVVVTRAAYRHRGEKNLCPADSVLNLPWSCKATACGAWRPSSPPGALSRAPSKPSSAPRGCSWVSARWRN